MRLQKHSYLVLFIVILSSTFPIEGLRKGQEETTLKNHLRPKRGSSDGQLLS